MRIVSLVPSASELVCALGLRDALVGVSHECDYPEGVRSLPKLTSSILAHGLDPAEIDAAVAQASLAGRPLYLVDGVLLRELDPDLIVTQGVCAVCAVTESSVEESLSLMTVEQASAVRVLSLAATDWSGMCSDITALGEATGREAHASKLRASLERRWQALEATQPWEDSARPTVAMLEWPDPPWFGGHWVPEQVAVAGGRDLFGTPGAPSDRLGWDQLVDADPDLLVAAACGYDVARNLEQLRALRLEPRFASLRAVRAGRVWAADANSLFSRPGPRIVEGAELLRAILVGDEVNPKAAVRAT